MNIDLSYNVNKPHASDKIIPDNVDNNTYINPFISYNFNDDCKNVFLERMCDDYSTSNLNCILDITRGEDFAFDNETIEACITGLNHVIEYAASPFTSNSRSNNTPSSNLTENKKNNNNGWYDSDCRNKKKGFDKARNLYKQTLLETD